MNNDPASLKNLHDVVSPVEVSWWPLAPGWYLVGVTASLTLLYLGWRTWQRWRANAYRRAALAELTDAASSMDVAVVLRRTALAMVEREVVAARSGNDWIDWLEATLPGALEVGVREELTDGLYSSQPNAPASETLRNYATRWIRFHSTFEKPAMEGSEPDAPVPC